MSNNSVYFNFFIKNGLIFLMIWLVKITLLSMRFLFSRDEISTKH